MENRYEIPKNADGVRRATFVVEDKDAAAIAVISEHLQKGRGWLTRTEAIRHALHYTAEALKAAGEAVGMR
jgi:hypothetical protein